MVNVFYKGQFTQVPDSWDELTDKQLREVCLILTGPYLDDVKRIRLLKVLMKWSWWKLCITVGMLQFWELPKLNSSLKRLQLFGKVVDRTARMANAAEQLTKFLFDGNQITRNIVPAYKGHYGPADQLTNVRMGEFCFAENYFMQWKITQQTTHLNMLLACLWRPAAKDRKLAKQAGDIRMKFNPVVLPQHAKKIDKWPIDIKMAMAMVYDGMRKEKIAANPNIFSGESSNENDSLYGLWSVMRGIAKAGHFGDFDKVQDQYVDTIMMELNEALAESERIEASQTLPTHITEDV